MSKTDFRFDKTIFVEFLSALSFTMMGGGLAISSFASPDQNSEYFWASIFLIFSVTQFLGIFNRKNLESVRICSAWFAGTIWVYLSYASINSIMAVPALFIGLFNIYAFVHLVNRATIDWTAFTHTTENVDSHT